MDRAEKIGLGTATVGHIILFGLLSVGFLATPNPLKIERNPVEVTFADDVGMEATTPRPSDQAPATSVAPELGTPEPEPAPPTPTLSQPKPAPAPPEPAPAPVPAPTPKPNKPPVRQPEAPAKAESPAKAAPAKAKPKGARLGDDFLKGITEAASVSRAQTANAAIGPREQASLAAELKRQLKPHWRPPSGADIEKLRVTIVANLDENGAIIGQPRVVGPTGVTASNRAQANLFVERAIAAVRLAAPYNFPKQYYAAWKTIRPQLYEGL